MQITIRDFMGCAQADIAASRIALLAGLNAQGKTSVCTAVALALAGQPVPAGMLKNQAGLLVRTGAAKGTVRVATSGEGEPSATEITYPKAQATTEGPNPLRASVWAAGLRSIATLPDKERTEILRGLIGAEPTHADFTSAAVDAGMDEKTIASIWKVVERDGWDSAHKRAQDKGRELKAQWDYATGEKYGEKKAEGWMPHGWSAGLEGTSKESLEAVVVGARAELEAAIAAGAVDGERVAQLQAKADALPGLRTEHAAAKNNRDHAKTRLEALQAELAALPKGDAPATTPCPHCQGALQVLGGKIIAAQAVADADLQARQRLAYTAKQAEVDEYRAILEKAAATMADVAARGNAANAAVEELAKLKGKPQQAVDVEGKRSALGNAERDLKAWQAKAEADRLHHAVLANQRIVDLLALEGVRRTVLQRALGAFNAHLAEVSIMCGWRTVAVSHDLNVEYGGRPYAPSCSESEQFRARTTLQLALAAKEGAPVVIDGADVLDAAGRSGLFNGIRKLGLTALVGMMANKPDAVPNLAKAGVGRTYWVEAGVVSEVAA